MEKNHEHRVTGAVCFDGTAPFPGWHCIHRRLPWTHSVYNGKSKLEADTVSPSFSNSWQEAHSCLVLLETLGVLAGVDTWRQKQRIEVGLTATSTMTSAVALASSQQRQHSRKTSK